MPEQLHAERWIADRALRELPQLRSIARNHALYWLNMLLMDIRRAEQDAVLSARKVSAIRKEAVLALGLVGIELERKFGRQSELDPLWDSAIVRVKAWRDKIA